MLKRMLIILVLLLPTALPATGQTCRLMMNHLSSEQHDDGMMSCCPVDGEGHCPMAGDDDPASSPESIAPETLAADSTGLTLCNCDLRDSSIPVGLPQERLAASETQAITVVTPVAAGWQHSTHHSILSRLNPGSGNIPFHLQQTSLRI